MCGRYALKTPVPEIARIINAENRTDFRPSYNVAPTRVAPVCRLSSDSARELVPMRWGLVPHWAKSVDDRYRMINARAETIAGKPAFRTPFRHRRCLVPVDGYYEWKALGNRKQPYFIHMRDESPFFLAGLWDRWEMGDDGPLESFTIVTTEAGEVSAEVHDRMPVILDPEHHGQWLDTEMTSVAELEPLLGPYGSQGLALRPVSTYVNGPENNGPRCIEPVADPG